MFDIVKHSFEGKDSMQTEFVSSAFPEADLDSPISSRYYLLMRGKWRGQET